MESTGIFPAITAMIGGRQRRLTLKKQLRRAILNQELHRETVVQIETDADAVSACKASEIPQLRALFDEILGPVKAAAPVPAAEPVTETVAAAPSESASGNSYRQSAGSVTAGQIQDGLTGRGSVSVLPSAQHPAPSDLHFAAYRQLSPRDFMVMPLKRYAEFDGRSGRAEYWWFYLAMLAGALLAIVAIGGSGSSGVAVLFGLAWLAVIIPALAVTIRRLHDRNMSGWWLAGFAVLSLIPGLGIITSLAFLIITILPGNDGPNRFGFDPRVIVPG